jgi:hypothetical protein
VALCAHTVNTGGITLIRLLRAAEHLFLIFNKKLLGECRRYRLQRVVDYRDITHLNETRVTTKNCMRTGRFSSMLGMI